MWHPDSVGRLGWAPLLGFVDRLPRCSEAAFFPGVQVHEGTTLPRRPCGLVRLCFGCVLFTVLFRLGSPGGAIVLLWFRVLRLLFFCRAPVKSVFPFLLLSGFPSVFLVFFLPFLVGLLVGFVSASRLRLPHLLVGSSIVGVLRPRRVEPVRQVRSLSVRRNLQASPFTLVFFVLLLPVPSLWQLESGCFVLLGCQCFPRAACAGCCHVLAVCLVLAGQRGWAPLYVLVELSPRCSVAAFVRGVQVLEGTTLPGRLLLAARLYDCILVLYVCLHL